MGVKRIPDLTFHIDRSEKMTARLDTILARVKKRQKAARRWRRERRRGASRHYAHRSTFCRGFCRRPVKGRDRRILKRDGTFLITGHSRPDGDAVGSMLAVAGILDQLGIAVDLVSPTRFLRCMPPCRRSTASAFPRTLSPARYAGAIVLECDGLARTGLSGLETLPLFNLDHHITGAAFGTLNWIDWTACAVAALVYKLAQLMQVQVTPAMATCLYTAVFTDTGAFTYPGTA